MTSLEVNINIVNTLGSFQLPTYGPLCLTSEVSSCCFYVVQVFYKAMCHICQPKSCLVMKTKCMALDSSVYDEEFHH